MTPTSILARIHKWKIDELRREISALESRRQKTQFRILEIDGNVEEEARKASGNLVGTFSFANFADASRSERDQACQFITNIDEKIAHLTNELNAAFQELKRYEIAEETRQSKEAAELARKEQIASDELGIEGHRRRQTRH